VAESVLVDLLKQVGPANLFSVVYLLGVVQSHRRSSGDRQMNRDLGSYKRRGISYLGRGRWSFGAFFTSSPVLVSWVFHDVGRDPGAFGFRRVAVHLDRLDSTFGHGEQTQECLVRVAKYQQLTGEGRDDG
jgi:hypothetical protein